MTFHVMRKLYVAQPSNLRRLRQVPAQNRLWP